MNNWLFKAGHTGQHASSSASKLVPLAMVAVPAFAPGYLCALQRSSATRLPKEKNRHGRTRPACQTASRLSRYRTIVGGYTSIAFHADRLLGRRRLPEYGFLCGPVVRPSEARDAVCWSIADALPHRGGPGNTYTSIHRLLLATYPIIVRSHARSQPLQLSKSDRTRACSDAPGAQG